MAKSKIDPTPNISTSCDIGKPEKPAPKRESPKRMVYKAKGDDARTVKVSLTDKTVRDFLGCPLLLAKAHLLWDELTGTRVFVFYNDFLPHAERSFLVVSLKGRNAASLSPIKADQAIRLLPAEIEEIESYTRNK